MALSYNQLLSKLPPYCKRRNIDYTPYMGGKKFIIKFKNNMNMEVFHVGAIPTTDKFSIYISQDGLSADGEYFFHKKYYNIREVTQVIKIIDEVGINFSSMKDDR